MEPMKWSEMHPWQRDQLVAEKVMGETNFICTGKLAYDGNNSKYMYHYYICQECKVRLTVTSSYLEKCKPPTEHNKLIPQYTTDMNAAWQIVEKIIQTPTKPLGLKSQNVLFMRWWQHADLWAMNKEEAAEAICLAALRAYGVKIEE